MPAKPAKCVMRFAVRLNGCSTVFKDGMPPGVILTQEVVYSADRRRDFRSPMFVAQLMEKQEELLREAVSVDMHEVRRPRKGGNSRTRRKA